MKPTPAETTILHLVISTAIAAIIGVISASVQFYYQHNFDIVQTLYFFVPSLLTSFGAMRLAIWHAGHASPDLPQAEHDAENQALQLAQTALQRIEGILPFIHSHPAAPNATPASQGRVSSAITSKPTPTPITFPQPAAGATQATSVPVPHFDTSAMVAVTPKLE